MSFRTGPRAQARSRGKRAAGVARADAGGETVMGVVRAAQHLLDGRELEDLAGANHA
jgi:hypothetical protein